MLTEPLVLIVYGATGFTGQLVAEYLDTHPELRGRPWLLRAGLKASWTSYLPGLAKDRRRSALTSKIPTQ